MARRGGVGVLAAFLVGAVLLHVAIGTSARIPPADLARALLQGPGGVGPDAAIVWSLRLPRALLAAEVGAILGLVGAAFQAVFRNPLAEPYVVGASSGAALGGAAAAAAGIGGAFFGLAIPLAATLGAAATLALVVALGGREDTSGGSGPLLLAGVAVGSLAGSAVSLVVLASGNDATVLLRWLLGSLTPAFWTTDALLGGALIVGAALLAADARALTAVAAGSLSAAGAGIAVERVTRRALVVGTVLVALAVGAAGIIGFLGLVAPHLARLRHGADLRRNLFPSALYGAGLLVLADLVAGRGSPTGEIPVGVLTALLGAPSLLVLLRRAARRG